MYPKSKRFGGHTPQAKYPITVTSQRSKLLQFLTICSEEVLIGNWLSDYPSHFTRALGQPARGMQDLGGGWQKIENEVVLKTVRNLEFFWLNLTSSQASNPSSILFLYLDIYTYARSIVKAMLLKLRRNLVVCGFLYTKDANLVQRRLNYYVRVLWQSQRGRGSSKNTQETS